MSNYARFTKAELLGFIERMENAERAANSKIWNLQSEVRALKEDAATERADIRERVEQQVEPLVEAIDTFTERLDFERAYGPLDADTHALVTDLFRHVAEASAAVYSVDH
jgi:phage host-nuclease inhibitor protein Gam